MYMYKGSTFCRQHRKLERVLSNQLQLEVMTKMSTTVTIMHASHIKPRVCVCVDVWTCERERERELARHGKVGDVHRFFVVAHP